MPSAKFETESAIICALASEERVHITPHALNAAADDDVARIDLEDMLCECTVIRRDESHGEEAWRVEGDDFDGRTIVAIVVPYETAKPPYLKVITCWVKK